MRPRILSTILATALLAGQVSAQPEEPAPAALPQARPAAVDADFPFPTSPFQPDLTPGYVLIEGDIQIRVDQYMALMAGADATFGAVTYWFNGIVPYDFVTTGGGAVSQANQNIAIQAMGMIAARAGITFRAATGSDVNIIRFQNSSFNNSPVGLQGGVQIINIVSWGTPIIICHEVYHSLGFWHEQSRADRNTYVTINANNICGSGISTPCTAGSGPTQCCLCIDNAGLCTSCAFNFNFQPGTLTYGLYDFDSFMHYGPNAFSCNGLPTIAVNPPWTNTIGQRDHFSYFDEITCRGLYPFNTDRWLDRNHTGTIGATFLLPLNNPNILTVASTIPPGATLFVKFGNTYSGVGTYTNPVTIIAPAGTVTIGN